MMATAAPAADAGRRTAPMSSRDMCARICQQLTESEEMGKEEWQREMAMVLERMRVAESAVFSARVYRYNVRRSLAQFAVQFGSRAVLEAGCARTPGGPAEAAQALDTAGNMMLHLAVQNRRLSAEDVDWVVSLHPAAAGISNQHGAFPLHLLVRHQTLLTPELVNVVLDAYPQALQRADRRGALPLHYVCANREMRVDTFHAVLRRFPDAAAIPNNAGRLPYHCIAAAVSTVRTPMAKMLMEATDRLFPSQIPYSQAMASSFPPDRRYVPPPPETRWASRPHPLSRQGRLKAGFRAVVRGRESVWQFQTGGLPSPGLMAENCTPLAKLVQVGHGSLVRQRLAGSAVTDVSGMNEAVLRALEVGHVEVVRDLLRGGSSAMRVSCTAEQACKWLGALMRHPQLDYSWLVEWMGEQCSVWGDVDLDRLCLEAAALSGDLALVESMAATWQRRRGSASVTKREREELGERAVAGGSVAVLRWLRGARLAPYATPLTMVAHNAALAKHDRLEMLELLFEAWSCRSTVRGAVEGGAIRVLRWLHVHTELGMHAEDMEVAIYRGHAAVVQFLHRHRNVSHVPGDHVLVETVRRSPPGTLSVVEYVLRHSLCGGDDDDSRITMEAVVNACTATTVRVEVVRYLVLRAREAVLCAAEEELLRLGGRQAQDVFRAARLLP